MKHRVFSEDLVARVVDELQIANLERATIGEVLLVASRLEELTGIPFIRMDQGSPGLPANMIGVEAEKAALDRGVGSQYPAAAGVVELKEAASRFVKAFVDIDIAPAGCIPTTGSVAASYGSFIACTQRIPGKNKVLFIDPGFPIQKSQLRIIGAEWEWFDIYDYRGEALRGKLDSYLKKGDIAAIVYSNPNNPAWICLEDSELKIIGELATKYDAVVLEDMAYFCMDFRQDLGTPFEPPYPPTVAKYTDNYILLISGSKIFSYAGQRIAVVAISDKLFVREFPALRERYGMARYGQAFVQSILYAFSSGVCHSAQHALAAMFAAAADGKVNFVKDTSVYAQRTKRLKEIFLKYGFKIVYDKDYDVAVSDGFFFTIGHDKYTGNELLRELLNYGVCTISLSTTGSDQQGLRACSSAIKLGDYELLEERLKVFAENHK